MKLVSTLASTSASAPSNIAWIKYMGKEDIGANKASNISFSYTVDHLQSFVELHLLEKKTEQADIWEPLTNDFSGIDQEGIERYIKFFVKLKDLFKIEGNYLIKSNNNFPADSGLASSASSFAALTKATWNLAYSTKPNAALESIGIKDYDEKQILIKLASISRLGSGSSCRSFLSPWAVWKGEEVFSIELPYEKLYHMVVVINKEKKKVSSSKAHILVKSSLLFEGRINRAQKRYEDLIQALNTSDWKRAFEITWNEFMDMHALFETSSPPFSYIESGSLSVLREIQDLWNKEGDGPIVTMDAGPNVHLFFRLDQKPLYEKIFSQYKSKFMIVGENWK